MATRTDAAGDVINAITTALRAVFTPTSSSPPIGGGTDDIRFFPGDGIPVEAFETHQADAGCDAPMVWVRLARRYRTQQFPTPFVGTAPCGAPVAIAVEIGVARCAFVDNAVPDWDWYAEHAEISLDDSWRLELALCAAAGALGDDNRTTASDTVVPYGPEGGVTAWTATLYVQL